MPNIDELTIQFKQKGVGTIVKNINALASAVESLSNKSQGLDAGKISALASALGELKGNVPTKTQVTNLENLATAISNLNAAAGSGSITTFANDISSVSSALNGIKGTPSKAIDKVTKSLQEASVEAKHTAESLKGVEKSSANEKEQEKPKLNISGTTELIKQFAQLKGHLTKASDMATKFGATLRDMKVLTPTKQMKSLQEQTEKVRKKYEDLRATMLKATQALDFDPSSKSWEKQQKELDGLRNKYDELILKQKELALAGGGFQLNPAIQGTLNAFGQGFTKVTSIVKSGFTSALHKANSVLGSLVKNMFRLVTASKAVKSAGNNVKDLAKKLSSELLRLSKMLKLMITRMALRTVIKEVGNGFKSLALHSKEFDKTMSDVINASKQLGYSFASMVSPLLNALAPAILYVIRLLTNLVNAINQVFSALRGLTTWNKAKIFTDKWSDSIKEAGKSGSKAAKELKKTVLAFDELNQLQDNKNSGGGGSDIKDMFETVEIDPKWKEFSKWLKDMWEGKDFTDLGKLWGTKIRDALESIPWEKIRKTSNDLGKCLATLINGLVEVERLGYDIGKTLAQSVNTVFEFFNGFVHKLHWDSIGKFLADTFNGFFETIDWKLIKDTVVTGLAGIANAIQNFIDTFHWDNISKFIINAVSTIVAGIKAFIEGIKWSDLGHKIGEQLTKTIKGINWREVGEAIGEIFQAALDFFSGIIEELDVDDVVNAASEMFRGFFDKVDTEKLGQTIGKILQFVIDFIKKFFNTNLPRMIEEAKKFFKGIFEGVNKADLIRIIYAIVNIALLSGVMSALKYVLGIIASKAIGTLIAKAMFGGTGGAGALGATLTKDAAAAGTQAGTTLADSMGAGVTASATKGGLAQALAGLKAAILPVAATVALGYAIAIPASKELEKILTENQTKVDGLKGSMDKSIPTYAEMSQAAREASRNQKEYAAKMQDMYDTLLKTHPELANLKKALEDNGIKIGNNVQRLLEINEGLNIFNSNGGSAADVLDKLEDKYGKVDKKTQDFFYSLGECNGKYDDVIDKVNTYNAKIDENDRATGNLIKTYQSEKEYLADLQKGHDNVVGSFKTHWDIVNQTKDATDKLTGTFKTHEDVMREYNQKLGDTKTATEKVLDSEKDVVGYTSTYNKSMQDIQTAMGNTGKTAEDTGKQIIEGIKEPMRKANFDVETKTLFDVVFKGLQLAFGIASPAKNMKPIGENIVLGVDEGMEDEYGSFDSTISDFYKNHVETWFSKDKWSFSGVGEGLKSTFENAKSSIKNVWNDIADKLNGEHDIGESKIRINLPKFAKGGMVEDGLFMANHTELVGTFSNGKTAVANNAQIVEGIQSGVYSAVMSAMNNSSSNSEYISNEIIVDGEVIARSITKAQEKRDRRYNPQTV